MREEVRPAPPVPPAAAEGKPMSLERLIHKVECDLYQLGQRLCGDAPPSAAVAEIEQLEADLRQAYDALSRCRSAATERKRRIAANEIKAALLASQVETYLSVGDRETAWEHALELDQLRQYLTADRGELPYLETAIRKQQRGIARLERCLAELRPGARYA
jgi:hypothetical protein